LRTRTTNNNPEIQIPSKQASTGLKTRHSVSRAEYMLSISINLERNRLLPISLTANPQENNASRIDF